MVHSLVIGGTKGLGRTLARMLAERGDEVSVIGRSKVDSSSEKDKQINFYQIDINNLKDLSLRINKIYQNHGPFNYCVFLQRYRGEGDLWDGELATTLTATKDMVKIISNMMSPSCDNSFVFVSSIYSKYIGDSQGVSYHVAKAGLEQLAKYYAVTLGPKHIRCNIVTPFTYLKEESKNFYLENKEIMELYSDIIPLKRMATAEDSAKSILFLCSSDSEFITGQNLIIDGGLSLIWPENLARNLMKV